jgi:hypothetical protein
MLPHNKLPQHVHQLLLHTPTPVSLRQIYLFGKSSQPSTRQLYVQKEIPKRLATILYQIEFGKHMHKYFECIALHVELSFRSFQNTASERISASVSNFIDKCERTQPEDSFSQQLVALCRALDADVDNWLRTLHLHHEKQVSSA